MRPEDILDALPWLSIVVAAGIIAALLIDALINHRKPNKERNEKR